jgi:hypothetical protein
MTAFCLGFTSLPAAELESVMASQVVVINEIMYNPPNGRGEQQYVELHNAGSAAVDISGWSISKGASFVLPRGTTIQPGGFVLIGRNLASLRSMVNDPSVTITGPLKGNLSHKGETLLLMDAQGRARDMVIYTDRTPWPLGADGLGSSLERICPQAIGSDPNNWASSANSSGAARRISGTPGTRNSVFSEKPLPAVTEVTFGSAEPDKPIKVIAKVADVQGVDSVSITWDCFPNKENETNAPVAMKRQEGDTRQGIYEGQIPPQPADRVVRFQVQARNSAGAVRLCPSTTEPRPAFSTSTYVNTNSSKVPVLKLLTSGKVARPANGRRIKTLTQAGVQLPHESENRYTSATIYLPPNRKEVKLNDFVLIRGRKGGYKVHFQKDQPFEEMTAINVIFESTPRWVLSEQLSYELYRLAGVPTPNSWHLDVCLDDKARGYYLMVEQPNRTLLRRQGRNPDGNLYKLIWYNQGVVGQHEKKISSSPGHDDLVRLIDALDRSSDNSQWEIIQQHFNVEEMINYYAVNMCIQNWDGFWNNYFAYHDLGKGGRWEVIPWDEDKTWGDYDGASRQYDWYTMPLTFGMKGDKAVGGGLFGVGGGPFGGVSWWRPAGYFSGPLLANPEFRRRFMLRLKDMCTTTFTPQVLDPIIKNLETQLTDEVRNRALLGRQDPAVALQQFHSDLESFHRQVVNRREFILKNLNLNR